MTIIAILIGYAIVAIISAALFAFAQQSRTGRVSLMVLVGAVLWPISWWLVYRIATKTDGESA